MKEEAKIITLKTYLLNLRGLLITSIIVRYEKEWVLLKEVLLSVNIFLMR